MLTKSQIEHYREFGYLVVPGVLPRDLLASVRATVDKLIAAAANLHSHTDIYDLEDAHTPAAPRVRRIKTPHRHFPFFAELTRNPCITDILAQILGSDIRLHGSKLNMKSAGYGAAVEWHQDWAFYPHTNDDVLRASILTTVAWRTGRCWSCQAAIGGGSSTTMQTVILPVPWTLSLRPLDMIEPYRWWVKLAQ